MASVKTNGDQVRFYLSGVVTAGDPQVDVNASLGGVRACTEVSSTRAQRVNAIPGVRLDYVAGENGVGLGSLSANAAGALVWTAPSGTAGTAVSIADGESKLLESGDADKWCRVTRTSASNLAGNESVVLVDAFNNLWDDVSDAEGIAGDTEYRCLIIKNWGATAVTDLVVSISAEDDTFRIAEDTGLQTVVDESTSPTALTWVTSAGSVSFASIAAGGEVALWIERTVAAGESGSAKRSVTLDYTWGAYSNELRLAYRIVEDALTGWLIYRGVNTSPDFTAAAFATATSLPTTPATTLSAGDDHHFVTRKRNQYGLISQNTDETIISVAVDNSENPTAPSAPEDVVASITSSGNLTIEAMYTPLVDGDSLKADTWVYWLNEDGTNPDPDVDSETGTITMGNMYPFVDLYQTISGTWLDGAPLRLVLRTRRSGTPDVDSTNTAVVSVPANQVGPNRVLGETFLGRTMATFPTVTVPTTKYWVDQPNNIYLLPGASTVSFYGDTELIWRCKYDDCDSAINQIYLPSDWSLLNGSVSGVASTDVIEVDSWTGPSKLLYVNSGGAHVMKIDVTNKQITCGSFYSTTAMTLSAAATAVWERYLLTQFQIWEAATENWTTYATVDSTSVMRTGAGLSQEYTQAGIEAL